MYMLLQSFRLFRGAARLSAATLHSSMGLCQLKCSAQRPEAPSRWLFELLSDRDKRYLARFLALVHSTSAQIVPHGSQCLAAGAEAIRTADPLCGSWRLRKARCFSEVHCAEADRRIILRAICWQIRAESGWNSAAFPRRKRPKRTVGSK